MIRIQLRISLDPTEVDTYLRIKTIDGDYYAVTATIDTGAQVSLLPDDLLEFVEHQLSARGHFTVEQAGISHQVFEATEAFITVYVEDSLGNHTLPFVIKCWFTDTSRYIVGFEGLLDSGALHIDIPQQSAYLEFTDNMG